MELRPDFISMIDATRRLRGGECLDGLVEALCSTEPSVAIRVNRSKGVEAPEHLRRVPWAEGGCYVDGERPRFTFDPALHQGLYYVQDASSMVLGQVVRRLTEGRGPCVYVDACAAPGGKTTAAIDALPEDSLVIANEFDPKRAIALCDNLMRWGSASVIVTRGDAGRIGALDELADIIAVDAPCSGEGMMRKDADAVEQWSEALVRSCAATQRDILERIWPALRPGGYLIYSTCTFNRCEDEQVVQFLVDELGAEPVEGVLPHVGGIAGGIDTDSDCARFIPERIDGEGLFMSVVRKPGRSETRSETPAKGKAHEWLEGDGWRIDSAGDSTVAFPARWSRVLDAVRRRLDVIAYGVTVATVKGRDMVPTQALALTTALRPGAFAMVDVDYATAIAYLRHEAVVLDGAPRGIVLLSYGGRPLGFVKNLGSRANNLYPSGLAIRSTYVPDAPVRVL